jgi:hypothetical protein
VGRWVGGCAGANRVCVYVCVCVCVCVCIGVSVARGEDVSISSPTEPRYGQESAGGEGVGDGEGGDPREAGVRGEGRERGGGGTAHWQSLLRQRFSDHSDRRDANATGGGSGSGGEGGGRGGSHSRAWNLQAEAGAGVHVPVLASGLSSDAQHQDEQIFGSSSIPSATSSFRREAKKEEIEQFASYLGMQPQEDSHLLWIAEAAVLSPVPAGWQQYSTEDGFAYFHSIDTGETSWEHPTDAHFKDLFQRIKGHEEASLKAAEIAVLTLSERRMGAAGGGAAGTGTDAGARHLAHVEEYTSEDERASRLLLDFDMCLEEVLDNGAAAISWGGSGGRGSGGGGGATSQRAGAGGGSDITARWSSGSSSRNSSWPTNSRNGNSLSRREQLQMAIKSELERYSCVSVVCLCVFV